jgi:1-acyl-sn-glycerol-3-phosphate acyltransferase
VTGDAAPLSTSGAATGRNLAALLTRLWRVSVTGSHLVPAEGPVILAANHTAFLDGVLLPVASPRPVHVMAKAAIWVPPLDRLLRATSQIPVDYDGPDRTALKQGLAVLGAGGVIGVFPEAHRGAGDVRHIRHGAAYLAARSGAPVVPVAILGARPAGAGKDALPRMRSRIDVLVGEPVDIRVDGDPRRRAVLARSGERLRQVLADHVRTAALRTGQELPGPLPDQPHDPHARPDHRSHP